MPGFETSRETRSKAELPFELSNDKPHRPPGDSSRWWELGRCLDPLHRSSAYHHRSCDVRRSRSDGVDPVRDRESSSSLFWSPKQPLIPSTLLRSSLDFFALSGRAGSPRTVSSSSRSRHTVDVTDTRFRFSASQGSSTSSSRYPASSSPSVSASRCVSLPPSSYSRPSTDQLVLLLRPPTSPPASFPTTFGPPIVASDSPSASFSSFRSYSELS